MACQGCIKRQQMLTEKICRRYPNSRWCATCAKRLDRMLADLKKSEK